MEIQEEEFYSFNSSNSNNNDNNNNNNNKIFAESQHQNDRIKHKSFAFTPTRTDQSPNNNYSEKEEKNKINEFHNSFKNFPNRRRKNLSYNFKTSISEHINFNINSKTTFDYDLFNKNYDLMVNSITDNNRRKKGNLTVNTSFSNFTNLSKQWGLNQQVRDLYFLNEEIFNMTGSANKEKIADFYEFTENCIEQVINLGEKPNIIEPIDMHFKNQTSDFKLEKKIAVFDLDETLVHCIGKITKNTNIKYDEQTEVIINNNKITIGFNIRPNWKNSLDMIKQFYHIVLYTASHQSYTKAILSKLDSKNEYFEYILYRNNCIPVNNVSEKTIYIKDLDIFKFYDLKNVILIDNSSLIYECHIDNLIPIMPYYESDNDNELIILAYYLLSIVSFDDLKEANRKFINMNKLIIEARNNILNTDKSEEKEEEEKDEENGIYKINSSKTNNFDLLINGKKEKNFLGSKITGEIKKYFTEFRTEFKKKKNNI